MNREMRRLSEREERRSKRAGGGRGRKPPISGKGSAPSEKRSSRLARIIQFLREVRVELKRVGWPNRQQMVAFTTVTLITTSVLTLVIFGLDFGFRRSVLAFIRMLTG